MGTMPYLFEIKPYIVRRPSHNRNASLPSGVRSALDRLKHILDTLPPEEMERRRQRYERVRTISSPRPPLSR